jgi:hypothetical protein
MMANTVFKLPPFAGLSGTILDVWRELTNQDVHVDLIYGACAWATLFHFWGEIHPLPEAVAGGTTNHPVALSHSSDSSYDQIHADLHSFAAEYGQQSTPVYYLNCGGLEGVHTQLARYVRKGLLSHDEALSLTHSSHIV